MKVQATLQGNAPALDVSSVLQLLESQHVNGTFTFGLRWICLRDGAVVLASGDPVAVVSAMLTAHGEFHFRTVPGKLRTRPGTNLTGILLEAARILDEAQVAAV